MNTLYRHSQSLDQEFGQRRNLKPQHSEYADLGGNVKAYVHMSVLHAICEGQRIIITKANASDDSIEIHEESGK